MPPIVISAAATVLTGVVSAAVTHFVDKRASSQQQAELTEVLRAIPKPLNPKKVMLQAGGLASLFGALAPIVLSYLSDDYATVFIEVCRAVVSAATTATP